MLIALLSDIHGNREALEACLDHAARLRADRYVFLGDFVGYGADPGWVVETARRYVAEGALALKGNHDEAVVGSDETMNQDARAAIRWTRQALDAGQQAFLADLPLAVEEGERLFVHANAHAPAGWDYITSAIEAERSLRRTQARLIFCGHVHVPALFQMAPGRPASLFRPVPGRAIPLLQQRRWLAVIGAVGQPRDDNPAACYALLQHEHDVLTYVRVPYDIDSAAQKILDAGLPPRLAARLYRGW